MLRSMILLLVIFTNICCTEDGKKDNCLEQSLAQTSREYQEVESDITEIATFGPTENDMISFSFISDSSIKIYMFFSLIIFVIGFMLFGIRQTSQSMFSL